MVAIKIDVGTLDIGNNTAPGQLEKAISDKLTDQQRQELYDSDLYRDVEITFKEARGMYNSTKVLYSYVKAVLFTLE